MREDEKGSGTSQANRQRQRFIRISHHPVLVTALRHRQGQQLGRDVHADDAAFGAKLRSVHSFTAQTCSTSDVENPHLGSAPEFGEDLGIATEHLVIPRFQGIIIRVCPLVVQ